MEPPPPQLFGKPEISKNLLKSLYWIASTNFCDRGALHLFAKARWCHFSVVFVQPAQLQYNEHVAAALLVPLDCVIFSQQSSCVAKQLMLISITTYLALPKIGPFGIDFLPRIELLMSFLRPLQAMAMHPLCCAPGEILTERCVLIFLPSCRILQSVNRCLTWENN